MASKYLGTYVVVCSYAEIREQVTEKCLIVCKGPEFRSLIGADVFIQKRQKKYACN